MTPATVSQACAKVKDRLQLGPGPVLDELIKASREATATAELPVWVRNVLVFMDGEGGKSGY